MHIFAAFFLNRILRLQWFIFLWGDSHKLWMPMNVFFAFSHHWYSEPRRLSLSIAGYNPVPSIYITSASFGIGPVSCLGSLLQVISFLTKHPIIKDYLSLNFNAFPFPFFLNFRNYILYFFMSQTYFVRRLISVQPLFLNFHDNTYGM